MYSYICNVSDVSSKVHSAHNPKVELHLEYGCQTIYFEGKLSFPISKFKFKALFS